MRRVSWIIVACLASTFALITGARDSAAQVRVVSPGVNLDAANAALRRGVEFESARRWGEALAHYEDALREFPSHAEIARHHKLAKTNYSIVRRYNDSSFRASLKMPRDEVLDLYDEVLQKVQTHYVGEVDWNQLVHEGTEALLVAMTNQTFVHDNLRIVPTERIDRFRNDLHQHVDSQKVTDRSAAVEAVRVAARLGEHHLRLSPAVVVLEYVQGAISFLDDYSTYLTADQLTDLYSQIDGNFVGLGIELQASDGMLVIVKVIPGSPAANGGLRPDDRIVAVDGTATEGMSTEKAASLLQGLEGSVVEVSVQAPGEAVRRVRIRRQKIEVPSVDRVRIVDENNGVGYLRLTSFQKTTPKELDDALWQLHRQGMRSLIIDLRGNPGGLLTTSVEVADRFISSGRIVSTRGRSLDQNWSYSAHRAGTWGMRLVVLIDRDSASASEIFSGAIRDHHRGSIVGQQSYGKGSVQSIFTLNHAGSGLRLTTARFYSPLGRPFCKVGVSPDIAVQQTAKPVAGKLLTPREDPVLAEGIRVARQTATR